MARIVTGITGVLALVIIAAWLFGPETRDTAAVAYSPLPSPEWPIPVDTAGAVRADAFRRAQIRADRRAAVSLDDVAFPLLRQAPADPVGSPLVCRYAYDEPSGTSSKFDCVLESGLVVKVKYGRNPEVHAETATATLLARLGYASDEVRIIPSVRCYGCPRYPFLLSRLLWLVHLPDPLNPDGWDRGYTDFEWVSVESRFDAPAITTETVEGWAWHELGHSEAPRADVDAFRLLAAFLAHWDNKSDNQRLVCLDEAPAPPDGWCDRPLLMIQDMGATFGPVKVNLSGWRDRPVWLDRRTCRLTMRDMPFRGATYPDVQIGEAGRVQLARQLASLSAEEIRQVFFQARVHDFYSGTNDERDLDAWTAAFRHRVDQIVNAGPCPL